MKKEVISKILAFFEENSDVFAECIEELDSWNGYLDGERREFMEDLDIYFEGSKPLDVLFRAYYGGDGDGNEEFNPNSTYFYFNGYGNLISTNYKDYSDYLSEYTIVDFLENRAHIDAIDEDDELAELFDELEKIDDAGGDAE